MSERETELVESKAGICNICGQTLESQAEVSIHLTDAHPDAERSDSAEDSLEPRPKVRSPAESSEISP